MNKNIASFDFIGCQCAIKGEGLMLVDELGTTM